MKKTFLARSSLPLIALTMSVAACESTPPEPVVVTPPASTIASRSTVTPNITWPAAATRDDRAFASLGDARRANDLLTRSPVPVLAPTNLGASSFERPTFVVGTEHYALTGRLAGGVTIAISGKRAAQRYENVAPVKGDRVLRNNSVRGFVSVNEGIRTSSWIENGAAYSVDIECAEETDARCASETFIIDLIEHLGFAGGSR